MTMLIAKKKKKKKTKGDYAELAYREHRLMLLKNIFR